MRKLSFIIIFHDSSIPVVASSLRYKRVMFRDDHSSVGHFLYPPNDNSLTFNYRDTVNVSWVTFDARSSGFLSLWYWPGKGPWLLSIAKLLEKITVQTLSICFSSHRS